jgi:hypothetical protein
MEEITEEEFKKNNDEFKVKKKYIYLSLVAIIAIAALAIGIFIGQGYLSGYAVKVTKTTELKTESDVTIAIDEMTKKLESIKTDLEDLKAKFK